MVITIDGPASSGKGTTARWLASRLQWLYLDTWALYRAFAYYLNHEGWDFLSFPREVFDSCHISCNDEGFVTINDEVYEPYIRTAQIGQLASEIACRPEIRDFIIQSWRAIIRQHDVVLDGRDTGTVWAPHADIKIYLTASLEVRAHRRWQELHNTWISITESEILQQIHDRDIRDQQREDGPLICPPGAYIIDTTDLTIEEQERALWHIVSEILHQPEVS